MRRSGGLRSRDRYVCTVSISDDRGTDRGRQRAVLRQAMTDTNASERVFHPGAIGAVISGAKNELKGPAGSGREPEGTASTASPPIVWKRYDELLRENNAVDFDDFAAPRLPSVRNERSSAREVGRTAITHPGPTSIRTPIAPSTCCLRYLADSGRTSPWSATTINRSSAGAGAGRAQHPRFSSATTRTRKVVKLRQNYRSTQRILDAAHSVVRKNAARKERSLWTDAAGRRRRGRDAGVRRVATRPSSSRREIERLQREGEAHGTRDVAVLYRTKRIARDRRQRFRAFGLAYQIVGGVSFYQRREVRTAGICG